MPNRALATRHKAPGLYIQEKSNSYTDFLKTIYNDPKLLPVVVMAPLFYLIYHSCPSAPVPQPISYVPFNQEDWKKKINARFSPPVQNGKNALFTWSFRATNDEPKPLLARYGYCCGLLKMWYARLKTSKNMLDTIYDESKEFYETVDMLHAFNSDTTPGSVEINKTYEHYKCAGMNTALSREEDYQIRVNERTEKTSIYQKFLKNAQMNNRCSIETRHYSNQIPTLKEYFEQLEREKRSNIGLNMLSYDWYDKCGIVHGHVIGWTGYEDKYLFFDANSGEYLFNTYEDLQNYICNSYFAPMSAQKITYGFGVEHYYSDEEYNSIQWENNIKVNEGGLEAEIINDYQPSTTRLH